MTVGRLVLNEIDLTPETLIDFVVERGSVSFLDIEDYFGQQAKGDEAWGNGNLVFWAGMSYRLVHVLNDGRVRDAMKLDTADPLLYALDERMQNYARTGRKLAQTTADGKWSWRPSILRKRPDEQALMTFMEAGCGKSISGVRRVGVGNR